MKRFMLAVPALTILAVAASAQVAGVTAVEAGAYVPAQTKIAVVRAIDRTGEKDDQKKDQVNAVVRETETQFAQRGFVVLPTADVDKAIADLKIDFADEEEQRREPLYKVGKAAGADIVVFSVITAVRANLRQNLFSTEREGFGTTKTWVLDVKAEKPILSAVVREGKSSGIDNIGQKGNRGRIAAASGNGVRDVLNALWEKYPRSKK